MSTDHGTTDFWEDAERVERFAEKDPDHRLVALLPRLGEPAEVRVLDLGCAGGRNTALLVGRGYDVHALDASEAMVARTRERVAGVLGEEEARRRVRRGRMDALPYESSSFDLVISVGVAHSAESRDEWERAADETARVLKPGGLLLFTQFTPEADLTGEGTRSVPGDPWAYDGLPAGRGVLLDAETADAAWSARGLEPDSPTETVRVQRDEALRVSVNGVYRLTADG